jgi:DNA-binding NtrC family response regulator
LNSRVLIVDDERNMCELLAADLGTRDFDVTWFTSAAEALEELGRAEFDVVLTDLKMPGIDGLELCGRIATNRPDVPVIVMTAFGSMETAIAAIRAGAYDFVTKPFELDILALTLQRAVKHGRLQEQVKVLSQAVERAEGFGEMLGASGAMMKLYDQLARMAVSDTSILITGESGTGKELVARSIHKQSQRHDGPFVVVNCAALPDTLLESELFGHAKGAFTDARSDRKGLFVQAEGGTLFLDEIGEMALVMQPKLLRALEENKIRPVGGDGEVATDVRIVTATNRDLETAIEENHFREDLFYRINVFQVELPPLRARGTDVLLLAQHFVETFASATKREVVGLSPAAAEKLAAYRWPGNVRELRNVIERAVALTRFDRLAVEDLPDKIRDYQSTQVYIGGNDPSELVPIQEMERRYILQVLEAVDDNKTLAAKILGLDRKTLYRKLRQYGEGDSE